MLLHTSRNILNIELRGVNAWNVNTVSPTDRIYSLANFYPSHTPANKSNQTNQIQIKSRVVRGVPEY